MITVLISFIGPLIFFVFKAANNSIRFSDTNVYFYTAQELLKGKLLYKDVFFTNLPLFPYISAFYSFILKNKIDLYYLTAVIEAMITSTLLFYGSLKKSRSLLVAFGVQSIYLFSFIVLSTSDHQTGVFLASLFSVIAYLLFDSGWFLLSGLILGFMVLTKAYYIPVGMGFFLYSILFKRNGFLKITTGFTIAFVVTLLPFFILAPKEIMKSVIQYSLFRSQGVDKLNVIFFFIRHDIVLALLLFYSVINHNKNKLFFFISLLTAITVFLYKDIYYLYLNMVIPFLALGFIDFIALFKHKKDNSIYIYIGLLVLLFIGFSIYITQYAALQKISGIENYVKIIKREKPDYLYGVMEITPALAYLTKIPLLENVVDTNENLFYSNILNAETMTKKALNSKTIIVSKGMFYPSDNIANPFATIIFDEKLLRNRCIELNQSPITTEGAINALEIFRCY